jgi:CRISPR/Cas system-associated endonuclease Cas1
MLLVLDRPGLLLDYERASLLAYEKGTLKRSVPVRQLERVVVRPRLELEARVLGLLAQHGVSLLVLNHRNPERTAELVAYRSPATPTAVLRNTPCSRPRNFASAGPVPWYR